MCPRRGLGPTVPLRWNAAPRCGRPITADPLCKGTPMSKFARRAGAAALAVGLVASVAACSSGGGEGDGSGDGTGATDESIILITPTPIGSNNFLQLAAD